MNFDECMEFIGSYSRLGGKVTDLSRARELMKRIGNPEKELKFVHIAGTNGKGSTLEYIANALELSGYRTGKFTSPFVLHYTDRIRINDREIDEKSLGEICGYVRERVADREYSQFEITMAIAFLWFVREKCDIVMLETGIGGLLDSTNVIPPPLLCVITSISLDHTEILGDTVEKIAEQKAGIIKKGSITVLSADNNKIVSKIIRKTAEKKRSFFVQPLDCAIKIYGTLSDNTNFSYKKSFKTHKYKLSMAGIYQVYNAVTAIEACFHLRTRYGFTIPEECIEKSLETTCVKARMQYIDGSPCVIVDGGHNPDAAQMLWKQMISERAQGKKIYVVTGMSASKDFEKNLLHIGNVPNKIFTVDDFSSNSVPAQKLADIASKYTDAEACVSLAEAVEKAKRLALENNGIVVVCGSLYLASEYLNNSSNQKASPE